MFLPCRSKICLLLIFCWIFSLIDSFSISSRRKINLHQTIRNNKYNLIRYSTENFHTLTNNESELIESVTFESMSNYTTYMTPKGTKNNKIVDIILEYPIKGDNNSTHDRIIEEIVRPINFDSLKETLKFLLRAALVGISTGIGVVIFKSSLSIVTSLFYETLADLLPKPVFYWPMAVCKSHFKLF